MFHNYFFFAGEEVRTVLKRGDRKKKRSDL